MKVVKNQKLAHRRRRHKRVRAKVEGTKKCPRLSVFKSNRYLSAQIIDDNENISFAGMSTKKLQGKGTPRELAHMLGKDIGETAKKAGVTKVVFDRGGFLYTGNVKAFADGARESGLIF